jgi:hypothetical protein
MKITNYAGLVFTTSLLMLAPSASAQAQSQSSSQAQVQPQSDSLADYARAVRKNKKPSAPKQYDNDNLPVNDKLSVVGPASADSDAKPAEAKTDADQPSDSADKTADKKPVAKADETPEEKQARFDEWKDKLSKEKGEVDSTAKELDLLQREYRLRAAAFYGDAGDRLRNSAEWDKENAQYQQQIADKQKEVDAAKQKLEDMQEDARKSGVPSADREQ